MQVGLSMLALQIYRIAHLVNFCVIPNAYNHLLLTELREERSPCRALLRKGTEQLLSCVA